MPLAKQRAWHISASALFRRSTVLITSRGYPNQTNSSRVMVGIRAGSGRIVLARTKHVLAGRNSTQIAQWIVEILKSAGVLTWWYDLPRHRTMSLTLQCKDCQRCRIVRVIDEAIAVSTRSSDGSIARKQVVPFIDIPCRHLPIAV